MSKKPATSKEPPKAPKEDKKEKKAADLSVPIAMAVLAQLGKPTNLKEVEVNHLWDNRYRVNVWCMEKPKLGLYSGTERVPLIRHSYFVWSSPEGGIMDCNPSIERLYKKRDKKPTTDEIINELLDEKAKEATEDEAPTEEPVVEEKEPCQTESENSQ